MRTGVILDEAELAEVVKYFMTRQAFAFDTESQGKYRGVAHLADMTWMSMATDGACVVIPFGHPIGSKITGRHQEWRTYGGDGPRAGKQYQKWINDYEPPPRQIPRETVLEIIRPLFFHEGITKSAHGGLFDFCITAPYFGEVMPGPYNDTVIQSWLIDENRQRHGLKYLTKDLYGFTYDDEEVGRKIEEHPFDKVAHYSHCDAIYAWMLYKRFTRQIEELGMSSIYKLELDVLNVLIGMRLNGSYVDVPRLEALVPDLTERRQQAIDKTAKLVGRMVNLNAPRQKQDMLYLPKGKGGQGLIPWKMTDTARDKKKKGLEITDKNHPDWIKQWSTDSESLQGFATNPVVQTLLEYQEVNKLLSTYVLSYLGDGKDKPCQIYDDRIHAEFVQFGTDTGRFSCVSGDTLLTTSRGTFRFDEYMPMEGDLVPTHRGQWQRVVRKVYKGHAKMYRVVLYNGAEIKCTDEHRVLTPYGWELLARMFPNDEVYSYDGIQEVYERPAEGTAGTGYLLPESAEAYDNADSRDVRYNLAYGECNRAGELVSGRTQEREGFALFTFKDEREEPYERKEWFPAPQLQRSDRGRQGISANQGGRPVYVVSSLRDGSGTGDGEAASLAGCAPYRRGPVQQRAGQSGAGDDIGTWEVACQAVKIREITPLGTMGVWDIEVEGDHSYVSHGFLNHNCRKPNLQNVPRPDTELGKLIRGAWVAPPGWKLVVADYSSIELVIFAHFAGQGALFDAFQAGFDPHQATADLIGVTRQFGKTINYSMGFGAGPYLLASMLGVDIETALSILDDHRHAFPELYETKENIIRKCRSRRPVPWVSTLLGHIRRLPDIRLPDTDETRGLRRRAERQAVSSVIQGSAADLIKLAMVRADQYLGHEAPDAFLSLTVHDELLIEAPESLAETAAKNLHDAMTGPGIQKLIDVPLIADVKIVDRWSEAKE